MNVIAYKMPAEKEGIIFQAGEAGEINMQGGSRSFVVAPFSPSDSGYEYELLTEIDRIPADILNVNCSSGSEFKEFSKEDYTSYIEEIKRFIGDRKDFKIVASRREKISVPIDCDGLFRTLCRQYPEAFVFFISVREFGTWIGASPELLLSRKGDKVESMSLAGTRLAGSREDWDIKNSLEQEIVTNLIQKVFLENGLDFEIQEKKTLRAGKVEHLMTPIQGTLCKGVEMRRLAAELSPTPALSGFPRKEALEMISRFEGDRILYGGYCGPVFRSGDFRLNVILRCACITPSEAVLFGGGGITAFSEVDSEWQETENKMGTLKPFLYKLQESE